MKLKIKNQISVLDIIKTEKNWCKGIMYSYDYITGTHSCCILGAIIQLCNINYKLKTSELEDKLKASLGVKSLVLWNDGEGLTFKEFKKAIKKARI